MAARDETVGADPLEREVARWMELVYVAAPGATLRREDRRKAVEVAALLRELERALPRARPRGGVTLVDAAAGKGYVGLLAAKLLLAARFGAAARVVTIEREERRASLGREVARRLEVDVELDCRAADVGDPRAWPDRPDVVVALHACGPAADAVIAAAARCGARRLLLVPCCTGKAVPEAARALAAAERLGVPRQAPVRRRFLQAMIDAARTLRLEAEGYQTEVVELVPPTVTPHNLLWRARRVLEPGRMGQAKAALATLQAAQA